MIRSLRSVASVALFAALFPASALAQSDSDKATARELGRNAEAMLEAQDYKGAEESFKRADGLFHAPTIVLGLARAQAKQGKVVEAWESYNVIIRENNTSSTAFSHALADAQLEIAQVEKRRAKVTVTVAGSATPTVTVDDAPLKVEALGIGRFMNPGPHVFKATAEGGKTATESVTIAEGATQTVALTLQVGAPAAAAGAAAAPGEVDAFGPPPKDTSPSSSSSSTPWQRTAGFVGMGVGGAFLIEGIITGVLTISKHSTLAKECPGGRCPPPASSDLSSYNTMGALSTVGFIAGPVLAGAGVVLFITAPKAAPAAPATGLHVTPYFGFGTAGAVGTF